MYIMYFTASIYLTFFLQYFALQILENLIKSKWKILPRDQCEGNTHIMYIFVYCVVFFYCSMYFVTLYTCNFSSDPALVLKQVFSL